MTNLLQSGTFILIEPNNPETSSIPKQICYVRTVNEDYAWLSLIHVLSDSKKDKSYGYVSIFRDLDRARAGAEIEVLTPEQVDKLINPPEPLDIRKGQIVKGSSGIEYYVLDIKQQGDVRLLATVRLETINQSMILRSYSDMVSVHDADLVTSPEPRSWNVMIKAKGSK